MTRRHLRRHLPLVALATGLAVSAGCGSQGAAGGGENGGETDTEVPINVRAMTVKRTNLPEFLTISGPLRPIHGTDVSTEETGVVAVVRRDKGSAVAEGEVMVELHREILEAEMRAADANRALREYDEDRTRKLFEANQVSGFEMLRVESAHEEARARADVARRRWERAAIKAPFGGLVADRYVEPGQLVSAGVPVVRVVNPYTLKLQGSVSEREVGWLREGSPATVRADGLEGTTPGEVHWVSFEAEPTTGKFQVEVRVENPELAIRPGIVARARVLKRVEEEAIVVPRDAVVLLPDGPIVFVVEESRAHARPVTVGPDQGLMAAIVSGLEEGERIVVRGQRNVQDGSLVDVQQEASALDGSIGTDPAEVRAASAVDPAPGAVVEGATP